MRLLKKLGKVLLYCAAALVLLSIGLRVYSAWQIPKAKRLLCDMSQLRAGIPFDDKVHRILSKYDFRALDPDDCKPLHCEFGTRVGAEYPIFIYSLSDRNANRARWFVDNIVVPLGLHPWNVFANLKLERGKLISIRYSFGALDQSGFGAGAEFRGDERLEFPDEDSPELVIRTYHRSGDLHLYVHFTPRANNVEFASVPNFSCVWGLRLCKSGYDTFPSLRAVDELSKSNRRQRLSSNDLCPAENMFSRARDTRWLWIGTVSEPLGNFQAKVRVKEILKNEREYGIDKEELVQLSDTTRKLFPGGLSKGEKVIGIQSNDCDLLPATKENMIQIDKALIAYPPSPKKPKIPAPLADVPRWHIPDGLR